MFVAVASGLHSLGNNVTFPSTKEFDSNRVNLKSRDTQGALEMVAGKQEVGLRSASIVDFPVIE